MANFQDILNKRVDAVERPKPHPMGTYLVLVEGAPKFSQVGENKRDVADFNLKILQPQPDVDPEEIEKSGGVNGKSVRARFFLTDDAVWRLDAFLFEALGIETGKSRTQAIAEAPGKQVMVKIKHRPSEDGTQMYHEISDYLKV